MAAGSAIVQASFKVGMLSVVDSLHRALVGPQGLNQQRLRPSVCPMPTAARYLVLVLALAVGGCAVTYVPPTPPLPPVQTWTQPSPWTQPAPPPRPIVLSPETLVTVCRPIDTWAGEKGRRPPTSFGFTARTCRGMLPDRSAASLVIVQLHTHRGRSPAREAGLRLGDRIITINGCTTTTEEQLDTRRRRFTPGNTVEVITARLEGGRYSPVTALIPTYSAVPGRAKRATCEGVGLRPASR